MERERSAAAAERGTPKAKGPRRRASRPVVRAPRKGSSKSLIGVEPTAESILSLQRDAGNRAVSSLLSDLRPVQREVADGQPARKGPSDIDLGFNALDIAHRLIEAIDQKQKKMLDKSDPGWVRGVTPVGRQINFTLVHDQLKGLTAGQVKEVEARYLQYEGRPLQVDLFGKGESGARPNLSVDQEMRLKALLGGTQADTGEDPEVAAQNQREADVWELRGVLKGDPKGDQIERVMTLLRRSPEEAEKLVRLYDGNWNINSDLMRMGYSNAVRAMILLTGSHTAADAYAIGGHRAAIIEIDANLAEIDPPGVTATDVIGALGSIGGGGGLSAVKQATIASLKARRKTHADAIEERVKLTAQEARADAEAGGEEVLGVDEAIRSRVAVVLGGGDAAEKTVGGTQGKLINAIARADPTEQAAAELKKLDERGQLTTDVLADTFRSLRQQAEVEAARLFPDDSADQLAEHTRKMSDQWFIHLRTTWDASVASGGRTFDQILDRGDQADVDYKRSLYLSSGKLADVDELVLALRGDRKDLETVKRILRRKTREEIDELKRLYKLKTTTAANKWGGSLDEDLLGFAPTHAGQSDTTRSDDPKGKAQGTDRLLIEDFLQRPYREGGKEEVDYIVGRAEREYQYTMDNKGATGWWRDHWGNEALSLLNATLAEVRQKRDAYFALTKDGTDRAAVRSRGAKLLIREMHFARATIRGDRAGYEKATAELRATFQAIASFVLQAVLTAVLTPAAAALFRGISAAAAATRYGIWLRTTIVSMSSTIAANKSVYGNEYTRDMLFKDLRGGLSGAIGSAAVGRLVDPIAGQLQSRLGKEMAGEFIEGAKAYGGLQATSALEGDGLVSFDEFAKQHFLGKVGERVTGVTAKGLGHLGYGPGPTHASYEHTPEGEEPTRRIPAAEGTAGGPGMAGEEPGGHGKGTATETEPDVDVDVEDVPTPVSMTLPPGLDKAAPQTGDRHAGDQHAGDQHAGDQHAGRERSQDAEEPPKGASKSVPEESTDSDAGTGETKLTQKLKREAEMARRAAEHPLDEPSLRSSTAPSAHARVLAVEFAPLFEQFKTMTDVVPRSQAIGEIIRRRLAAEGVHDVTVLPEDLGETTGAEFSVVDWQISLNSRRLASPELTVQQFSALVEAATHEARHALHHWRGLRVALQEGKFRSDSMLRPNADAVNAAREANKASPPTSQYSEAAMGEALEIYEQTFGKSRGRATGERERDEILRERNDSRDELKVANAAAKKAEDELPAGSPRREATKLAAASAYARWTKAHNAYIRLPQETDAFRRGMAMSAAMVEALTLPKIDAARQAARTAHAEQVTARRRGDSKGAGDALTRYNAAVDEARKLRAELDSQPYRSGQQTTLAQDLAFAREAREQAKNDANRAKAAGQEEARVEAVERYREAADEVRRITAEIAKQKK